MDLGAKARPCQTIFCAVLKFSSVIHSFRGLITVVKTDMSCHSLTVIVVSTCTLHSGQGSKENLHCPHAHTAELEMALLPLVPSLEINNLL